MNLRNIFAKKEQVKALLKTAVIPRSYDDWIKFDENFGSNHGGKYHKCGVWVKPVFPGAINLQGSIPTPYIFDDRADIRDVAEAIMFWYNTEEHHRESAGMRGREWAISEESGFTAERMANKFASSIETLLENWVAPKRFNLYSVEEEVNKSKKKVSGISI